MIEKNEIREMMKLWQKFELEEGILKEKKMELAKDMLGQYFNVDADGNIPADEVKKFLGIDEEMEEEKHGEKKGENLILVFYIEVGDMEVEDIPNHMARIADMAKKAGGTQYFIPTRNQPHSRIECINPTLATPDEKAKITKLIDELGKSIKELSKEEND